MTKNIIISIDELWLKGRNQKIYLQAIIAHIDNVFKAHHEDKVVLSKQGQRLYYESKTDFNMEMIEALILIPGIASVTPAKILPLDKNLDLTNMYEEIVKECAFFAEGPKTFRACVKKNHQKIEQTSVEIEREIGAWILRKYHSNAIVSLEKFDVKVEARIYGHYITISTVSYKGIGGLPWGTNGQAITMLSGGFDSPVASYMMMRRGIKQDFVFFHAYPYVGREVLVKIKNLASRLAQFQKNSHLYIVSFGDIQKKIAEHCQEEYKTMFFRRAMVEISNIIAEKIGADCLITGDSLGQVSSQTLGNMGLMDKASARMILRPLIGFNKLEILSTATQIKTHDISIIPHDDACALFAPKHPVIHPDLRYWDSVNFSEILKEDYETIFDKIESYSINSKGELFKKEYFSYDFK